MQSRKPGVSLTKFQCSKEKTKMFLYFPPIFSRLFLETLMLCIFFFVLGPDNIFTADAPRIKVMFSCHITVHFKIRCCHSKLVNFHPDYMVFSIYLLIQLSPVFIGCNYLITWIDLFENLSSTIILGSDVLGVLQVKLRQAHKISAVGGY